jgi:hypothetical protein
MHDAGTDARRASAVDHSHVAAEDEEEEEAADVGLASLRQPATPDECQQRHAAAGQ